MKYNTTIIFLANLIHCPLSIQPGGFNANNGSKTSGCNCTVKRHHRLNRSQCPNDPEEQGRSTDETFRVFVSVNTNLEAERGAVLVDERNGETCTDLKVRVLEIRFDPVTIVLAPETIADLLAEAIVSFKLNACCENPKVEPG
ncbi:hypothetical protein E3N88_05270 [Mikania micrantha]|uniref:Uncharacterized protein n=1 Tax=Mikania micrantha TaxID=192012 RepID=A0A5N6PKG9_9ASTR|nr:hypothetical protein E3N88_05270 [Mikania micrantha]